MALSYHELTYNQEKDPKAHRQQFLILCIVIAVVFFHSAISAGILTAISIENLTFAGGEFVYKLMTNDYVACFGSIRTISGDLGIDESGLEKQRDGVDLLYTIHLDDPVIVPGGQTRFASGALLQKGEKVMKDRLLEVNKSITGNNGGKQSKNTRYNVASLPKVDAVAIQHPFTDGAWSALLMRYKIVPAFKKYAKEILSSDKNLIIISTCSDSQSMCTFYMPLTKQDKFYVGEMNTKEYANSFDKNAGFLYNMGVDINLGKVGGVDLGNVWRGVKKAVGFSVSSKKKDEL